MKEIENTIKKYIGVAKYDEFGGQYIWGTNQSTDTVEMIAQIPEIEEGEPVVSIRGWGAIQNMKNLPCTPEEFQDAIGSFVAEAINEKISRL
jgi:hypothetical protein